MPHAQPSAEARRFCVDRERSRMWVVARAAGGRYPVTIAEIGGEIQVDSGQATRLTLTADLTSVDAGSALLTDFVRSERVLDVARFPIARFESRRIEVTPKTSRVVGDLTLHGVKRTIAVEGRQRVARDEATAQTQFSIDREDYDIAPGAPAEWVLADELDVFVEISAKPAGEAAACPMP